MSQTGVELREGESKRDLCQRWAVLRKNSLLVIRRVALQMGIRAQGEDGCSLCEAAELGRIARAY